MGVFQKMGAGARWVKGGYDKAAAGVREGYSGEALASENPGLLSRAKTMGVDLADAGLNASSKVLGTNLRTGQMGVNGAISSSNALQEMGAARRFAAGGGATPVQSFSRVPLGEGASQGLRSTMTPSQGAMRVAGVRNLATGGAAMAGIQAAHQGLNTDTAEYAKRTGRDYDPNGSGFMNTLQDTGTRAIGVLGDLGRNIIDPVKGLFGMEPSDLTKSIELDKQMADPNNSKINMDEVNAIRAKSGRAPLGPDGKPVGGDKPKQIDEPDDRPEPKLDPLAQGRKNIIEASNGLRAALTKAMPTIQNGTQGDLTGFSKFNAITSLAPQRAELAQEKGDYNRVLGEAKHYDPLTVQLANAQLAHNANMAHLRYDQWNKNGERNLASLDRYLDIKDGEAVKGPRYQAAYNALQAQMQSGGKSINDMTAKDMDQFHLDYSKLKEPQDAANNSLGGRVWNAFSRKPAFHSEVPAEYRIARSTNNPVVPTVQNVMGGETMQSDITRGGYVLPSITNAPVDYDSAKYIDSTIRNAQRTR